MAKIIVENYTFDASAKTIALEDFSGVLQQDVLLITNVTDGIIIYNFADPAKGCTGIGGVNGNVLTLEYDTTSMDDADVLQIIYNNRLLAVDQYVFPVTTDGYNPLHVLGTGQTGVAVPSTGFLVQGSDGTNARNIATTAGGVLKIDGTATTQPVSLSSVPSHAVTNAGTFAVQDSEKLADNAGFTDGTTKLVPVGYIYDEVAGTALTENDIAAARINANRATVSVLEDGTTRGRYATITASNALKVDASAAAIPVTDNSGSLTVDAPVATPVFVRLSDGSAAITNLATNITQLAGTAVDTNSGNKSAGTQRVVIATDQPNLTTPLNTNVAQMNGVTVTMGNGASGTGVQRVTIANDSTGQVALAAGTALAGKVAAGDDTSTVYNGTTALVPKFAVIAASASGNNTLVASVSGKKIRVLAYNFIANGTVNAKFQSGAGGTDLTGLKYCVANTGICAPYNPLGWFETAATTLLNLNLSGAIAVGGELVYVEV